MLDRSHLTQQDNGQDKIYIYKKKLKTKKKKKNAASSHKPTQRIKNTESTRVWGNKSILQVLNLHSRLKRCIYNNKKSELIMELSNRLLK